MLEKWIAENPGLLSAIQGGLVLVVNLGILYVLARRLPVSRKADASNAGPKERPTSAEQETQPHTEEGLHPESEQPAEEPEEPDKEELLCFVVDSLFLAASYRYVCGPGLNEVFHYVTGVKLGHTVVLSHVLPVTFGDQSPGSVRVDDRSNIQVLEELDAWGLPLLGHVHSHPMSGPGGTSPSGIDRRFAERLARGGYVAIGMVFSRDGFVRFFAHDSIPFRVEVKGHQVRRIDDYVFKLNTVADRDIPISVHPAAVRRRAGCGRSPEHDSRF